MTMDDQLEQISTRLKRTIRQTCDDLVTGIDEELQAFKDASASTLQDYENLRDQQKLTLESCEALKSQNVCLQAQLKELLAKESDRKIINQMESATRTRNRGERSTSREISSSIQSLIDQNPELQAILDAQAADYKKLQAAHEVLLRKLKEHQEVIVQLQHERTNSEPLLANNEEHITHLRSIINPSRGILNEPHESPSRNARASIPVTIEHEGFHLEGSQQGPGIQSVSNRIHEIIDLDSVPPENTLSNGIRREFVGTVAVIPTNQDQEAAHTASVPLVDSTLSDSSQPVFVTERPVKRRRTGHSEASISRIIKSEPILTQAEALEECHSSDLDIVPAPIVLPKMYSGKGKLPPTVVYAEISETNRTAAKRHSEPPIKTQSISLGTDHEPSAGIVIQDEPGHQSTEDSRNDSCMPPQPSSGDSYFQGKPQRPALQPKPSNAQIIPAMEQSGKQPRSAIEKKGPESIKTKRVRNIRSSTPIAMPARKVSNLQELFIETGLARSNNTSANAAGRYQTSLQKKRGQAERRLRGKSIGELSLNDFVLNPAMNQGFNQALGEIDNRKSNKCCPPNCSKPECCGNAFASAIRSAGTASLQDLSTQEKDNLIESYLGFPLSTLELLSNQGYQKLLGEAIGKQFAEKYGRLKQARADSPPGYWRAEFPSTQERDADKRCAEQIEKAAIADRRREALRSGGLWVFRDE